MSIIQQIREKYAVAVIGLIVLSLIGFILMDAGRTGAGQGSPNDAIGQVNGTSITYASFLEKEKMAEQQQEMRGQLVDENTRQQIYASTWKMMVESELVRQEMAKLGLKITDKEFNDMLFGANPPEFLTQQFTDPKTGAFDAAAAKQAIASLKKDKNGANRQQIDQFYLQPMIENALFGKYFALVQGSSYVPKWLAEKSIADNNAIASFSYVNVPYTTIADSTVKVTDDQINTYVQAHKNEFKQDEASRSIAYVSFGFLPTATDSAQTLQSLLSLKEGFATASDPGAYTTRNSSAINFYDGYLSKTKIQLPNKEEIIGAGLNTVYGPYIDGNSYVLSRVVDSKVLPDSVKARHILISLVDAKTQQPKLSDSAASKLADSLMTVVKGGGDFAALALMYSEDEGSKVKGGDLGYFTSGRMVPEFDEFCFSKKAGETGIVKTQFGYHIIQVQDQKNFEPSYKIAYLAKTIEPSQATLNDALSKANIFAGNSRTVKAFEESAKKNNYQSMPANDIKENDFAIPGLGANRKVVKEIFDASTGSVLDPEQFDNQYVVIAITGEDKAGLPSAAKVRTQVEPIIRNQEKAKLISNKIGKPASLEAVAQAQGLAVLRADSVSFSNPTIPGAGYELKATGYAFGKNVAGKISAPIAGNAGVYVVKPETVAARTDAAAGSVEEQQNAMAMQQRQSILYGSIQALRSTATIKDKRSKFF